MTSVGRMFIASKPRPSGPRRQTVRRGRFGNSYRMGFMIRIAVLAAILAAPLAAQEPTPPPVIGRWDLTLTTNDGQKLPSWLEVSVSGNGVLVGRFVGVVGSVRPISRLAFANDTLRFSIPPQWEDGSADVQFAGVLRGDSLAGTITDPKGTPHPFAGVRAPALRRTNPAW